MKKAAAYTLGCKVNQYDTQAMLELLQKDGYEIVSFHTKADVYLINTCTVTNIADRKSRQAIARAADLNPEAVIVVAGCLSQRSAEELLSMRGVRAVLGTADRSMIVRIVEQAKTEKVNAVGVENSAFENLTVKTSGEMTRGYIKIQEGCNHYCSYCIIPYVRGPARSRPLPEILCEARSLAESGVREVVLTGINISSYKTGDGGCLADVLAGIDNIEGILRIRLGSLEPGLLTPEFLKRLKGIGKLCPHFHVSLQSGSDGVLARMNRKYTAREYARTVENIRCVFDNPAITTDVITGFPGETEEEFQETLAFVRQIGFSKLHVFPYSERTGTKAAGMEGMVPMEIRKKRANILITIGKEEEYAYIRGFLNQEETVLFERVDGEGLAEGHTGRYVKVRAKAEPNDYEIVLMQTQKNDILFGEVKKGG
jgi:threonylcarbamoyladenosine tRNA methylthiotransferase MtaB